MQNEIAVLRKELSMILNRDSTLRQAMRQVNKMDMIKASLIARNSRHRNIPVDRILEGELQKELTIGDCIFIRNFDELVNSAYNNLDMGNSVNRNFLVSAYRILADDPEGDIRKSNPVVYTFNHVPPDFQQLEDRLTESFRRIYSGELENDVVARAMYMHNCIIGNWPFEDFSGELAIFAMNYYLMEQGLMPIDMPIERQDYLDLVIAGLKGTGPDEEYNFFRKAIISKMANTIEVCKGYVK